MYTFNGSSHSVGDPGRAAGGDSVPGSLWDSGTQRPKEEELTRTQENTNTFYLSFQFLYNYVYL